MLGYASGPFVSQSVRQSGLRPFISVGVEYGRKSGALSHRGYLTFTQSLYLLYSLLCFISSPTLYGKRQPGTTRGVEVLLLLHFLLLRVRPQTSSSENGMDEDSKDLLRRRGIEETSSAVPQGVRVRPWLTQ